MKPLLAAIAATLAGCAPLPPAEVARWHDPYEVREILPCESVRHPLDPMSDNPDLLKP